MQARREAAGRAHPGRASRRRPESAGGAQAEAGDGARLGGGGGRIQQAAECGRSPQAARGGRPETARVQAAAAAGCRTRREGRAAYRRE